MERRVRGNLHARCGTGENPEKDSRDYLSSLYNKSNITYTAEFVFDE